MTSSLYYKYSTLNYLVHVKDHLSSLCPISIPLSKLKPKLITSHQESRNQRQAPNTKHLSRPFLCNEKITFPH